MMERVDHIQEGLELLRTQWKGKVGIEGVLTSYLKPLQDAEDMANYLMDVTIFNAVGEELDIYGWWYGVEREGRRDEPFRAAILSRVGLAEADASPEGIMEAVRAYGQTDQVGIWQHYPAYAPVYMGAGYVADMYTILLTLVAAGVETGLIFDDNGDSFRLTESYSTEKVLVNQEEEAIVLERAGIPHYWSVSSSAVRQAAPNYILSENVETGGIPLADISRRGVISVVGRIVDEFDDPIVDELGNNIMYTEIKFKEK